MLSVVTTCDWLKINALGLTVGLGFIFYKSAHEMEDSCENGCGKFDGLGLIERISPRLQKRLQNCLKS